MTFMNTRTNQKPEDRRSLNAVVRGFVRRIFPWVDAAIREREQLLEYVVELGRLRRRRARAEHLKSRSEKAAANIRRRGREGYMALGGRAHTRWFKCYAKAEEACRRWREEGNAAGEELARKLESAKASNEKLSDGGRKTL